MTRTSQGENSEGSAGGGGEGRGTPPAPQPPPQPQPRLQASQRSHSSTQSQSQAQTESTVSSAAADQESPQCAQSVPMPVRRLAPDGGGAAAAAAAGSGAEGNAAGFSVRRASDGPHGGAFAARSSRASAAAGATGDAEAAAASRGSGTFSSATAATSVSTTPATDSSAAPVAFTPAVAPGALGRHLHLSQFLHGPFGSQILLNRLRSGGVFLKHGSRGPPHFRFVQCDQELTRVQWIDLRTKKMCGGPIPTGPPGTAPASSVPTDSILAVTLGHATRLFRERFNTSAANSAGGGAAGGAGGFKECDPSRCLSLSTTSRTVDLECTSEQERDLWFVTFSFLLEHAADRRKRQIQQQHGGHAGGNDDAVAAFPTSTTTDAAVPQGTLQALAPPPNVPLSQLSLVHALEVLCEQSIGRALAQAQTHALQVPEGVDLRATKVLSEEKQPPQSSQPGPPAEAQQPHPVDSNVAPHPQQPLHRYHSAAAPQLTAPPPPAQAPLVAAPAAPVPATNAVAAAPGAAGAAAIVPSGGSVLLPPAVSTVAPLNELESARSALSRELDQAREENRALYVHSARRMIQLQEKIDALTGENVALIRALKPQQW